MVLNADAVGHGWFVDVTPNQAEEFVGDSGVGAAAGRVDLLTAVLREMAGVDLSGALAAGVRQTRSIDALFGG